MNEAANADEDEPELDDLARADGVAAAPAAAASFVQRHRQRNAGFLGKRKASKRYALAMQQLAQAQQWQREADILHADAQNRHKQAALLLQEATIDRQNAKS